MADLYGTNNDPSSSSLESEDMSSFLQTFLNNSSTKGKYGRSSPQISTHFLDSDQRFSHLSSFYSTEANRTTFLPQNHMPAFDLQRQEEKVSEGHQTSNSSRSSKRTRAAEIHNLSEKRRRSRINEKLKALQTLVPNSNKTDKASMLDEAIEYLKQLQLKVQTLTMKNGFSLQPVYSQEEEMQRGGGGGGGMEFDEGYKLLPNPVDNGGFEFEMGMSSLTNMMKQDTLFGSEHPMKEMSFSGKISSPGLSSS